MFHISRFLSKIIEVDKGVVLNLVDLGRNLY